MKTLSTTWSVALIALCALITPIAAGRLALRPLSPGELRRALSNAGATENELMPDGRSVSSALSGLKGFALGVTKGIGGAILFDVVTSNETAAYVNFLLESLNTQTNTNTGNTGTSQEVCFSSRSLNGALPQARNDANDSGEVDDDDANLADNDDDEDVDDFVDDDDEDYSSSEGHALGRQNVNYDYIALNGGGLTCIVVNRGRALFRHRRSLASLVNASSS